MKIRYYQKREGGPWWIDFRDSAGERKRVPTGCDDRKAAERAAPGVIARVLTGATEGPVRLSDLPLVPTIADKGPSIEESYRKGFTVREQWIKSKAKHALQSTFDAVCEGLKEGPRTPTKALTRDFVRTLRAEWIKAPGKRPGTTLTASTINHRLSLLSVLLEIEDLPPHGVKHLSTRGNRRERRVTDNELQAAYAWFMANHHFKGAVDMIDLITASIETGARAGELLGLSQRDVAEDTAVFRDTKNGDSRTVPLNEAALRVFDRRREYPEGPFSMLSGDRAVNLWAAMRKGLGLADDEDFVFHTLRHEFASRQADKGTDAFTLMALMGHSSITTTQVYVKSSLGAMKKAVGA